MGTNDTVGPASSAPTPGERWETIVSQALRLALSRHAIVPLKVMPGCRRSCSAKPGLFRVSGAGGAENCSEVLIREPVQNSSFQQPRKVRHEHSICRNR